MRRIVAVVCAQALGVALLGCAAGQITGHQPAAKRAIPSGALVALNNGLTLTIPAGWEATLTAYSTPDGDLEATENLVAENLDATSGPKALMVFSSSAATLSPESINDYGHDEFVSVGNIDGAELLVGTPERGFSPKRLMAAQTRIPRAQLGLLYFAGDPADPATAFRDVCRLFAISGL